MSHYIRDKDYERYIEYLEDKQWEEWENRPYRQQEEEAVNEQYALCDTIIGWAIEENDEALFVESLDVIHDQHNHVNAIQGKDAHYASHLIRVTNHYDMADCMYELFVNDQLYCNRANLLKILVTRYKQYINIQDALQRTPLMKAIINADIESVNMLIRHGASTCSTDLYGDTVFSLACQSTLKMFQLVVQKYNVSYNFFSKVLEKANLESSQYASSTIEADKNICTKELPNMIINANKKIYLTQYLDLWNFKTAFNHDTKLPKDIRHFMYAFLC